MPKSRNKRKNNKKKRPYSEILKEKENYGRNVFVKRFSKINEVMKSASNLRDQLQG